MKTTRVSAELREIFEGRVEARHLLFVAANPSIDRLAEVDRLTPGAIHRPIGGTSVPGGKGFNAARAAATLGGAVRVVGVLGGHAGRWVADELERLRVDGAFVWTAAETRTCLSILDRSDDLLTEVYEPGTPIEPADWAAFVGAVAAELARRPALMTLSGSLPQGAPVDGFAGLCRAAVAAGIRTVVDTSGEPLERALECRPWLVKVNAAEAGVVTRAQAGDEAGVLESARRLAHRAKLGAIVTNGRAGAVAVTTGGSWRAALPGVAGRYPVGSGDAFLGGLAAALAAGWGIADAVALGVATGAANAGTPGAGIFERSAVAEALDAVRIQLIETQDP